MGRMRRTLAPAVYISSLLAAVLLWPIPLLASTVGTNYTVKSGGGGNYTTIQQCATAMAAGDTCTVFAGTYNENVTVSAGGVGAYKTLTVNGSDTVFVLSFTINPHVRINGFHIQNPSSPHARECVFPAALQANSSAVGCRKSNMALKNEIHLAGNPITAIRVRKDSNRGVVTFRIGWRILPSHRP